MPHRRARVLFVDDSQCTLSFAFRRMLNRHDVDVAQDAFEAIYRIDCAPHPYDVILCDLARGDLPGPELWAYLSLGRKHAAERMVFVASAPLPPETHAFVARIPNPCIDLPTDLDAFEAMVARRARGVVGETHAHACQALCSAAE